MLSAPKIKRELLALAHYAGHTLPDDDGNHVILASGVEELARDAARLIDILASAVDGKSQ